MNVANSSTMETHAGPFTAVVTADGAVLASGWTSTADDLLPLIAASLRPSSVMDKRDLGPVTAAIRAYHDGDFHAVDDIEVRQRSSEFTEWAWSVLRGVPPGKPVTYAGYAALAGRPAAIRAAASACARNGAALFVPCHRVVRTGGGLGGFRWGVEVKRWLLDHESTRAE